MSTATAAHKTKSVTIMGPHMVRGRAVLNAIDALIYLPESYRLVFAGNPQDQSFYNEVVELVERFNLGGRVHFMYELEGPSVVVASDDGTDDTSAVHGDSPEALASAILHAVRL